MPYYNVGDYYGRGDYYRGDPFLGGLFKGIAKIGGAVLGATPVGAALKTVGKALIPTFAKKTGTALIALPPDVNGGPGMLPTPGFKGAAQRFLPGGATGYYKRRTMNPMNVKALRRASRRIDGFVKTARRALKHTSYTISRRGALRSPGVITRAEAARALKR